MLAFWMLCMCALSLAIRHSKCVEKFLLKVVKFLLIGKNKDPFGSLNCRIKANISGKVRRKERLAQTWKCFYVEVYFCSSGERGTTKLAVLSTSTEVEATCKVVSSYRFFGSASIRKLTILQLRDHWKLARPRQG